MTASTATVFAENLIATWDLFKRDSGVVEVRAILKVQDRNPAWEGWGDIVSGYFDDYESFAECVTQLESAKQTAGTYITLNPVMPALLGRAKNRLIAAGKKAPTTADDDIISRRTLLIDADPFRPAGISSTNKEMEAAIEKASEVAAYLHSLGFPEFYRGNSGNGGHLIGLIDLPNDAEAKQLISDFLDSLNWKFGTVPSDNGEAKRQFSQEVINVGIDTTVFNAARIGKLYGTATRKGDHSKERPHRRAKLTRIPADPQVIPVELLELVAQEYRSHKAQQNQARQNQAQPSHRHAPSTNSYRSTADWCDTVDGVEGWLRDHGVSLSNRDAYTSDGYQYKWLVDCLTSGGAHRDGAAIMWGAGKGLGYKCHHNGCKGQGWTDVRNLIDPRIYPSENSQQAKRAMARPATATQTDRGDEPEPRAAPAGLLDDLLSSLNELDGSETDVLESWAIDNASLIGKLRSAERTRLYIRLNKLGVSKTFTTRTLSGILHEAGGSRQEPKQADQLVELMANRAHFFTGPDGEQYASVKVGNHRECYRLKSNQFNDYLSQAFHEAHKTVIGAQARADAKSVMAFQCRESTEEVFVRVGHHAGAVYIDLGSAEWDAIRIDATGWSIEKDPPVHFRRTSAMQELPLPVPSEDTYKLALYLNIEEEQWPLIAAYIVQSLHPRGPYPILIYSGEQGTAKSTQLRVLKELIDPSAAALRGQPDDIRDLMIAASNSWLLTFDNVSSLSPPVADAMCRISTGGGYTKRANYSDGDEFVIDVMRPIAINGIGDITTRGDVMDRAIVINPPVIPESRRQDENAFWDAFNRDKPEILGAFLTALSVGLQNLDRTRLESKPRMADFARLAVAAEPAYGDDVHDFLKTYQGNRLEASSNLLESSLIARLLKQLVAIDGRWQGTPTQLWEKLGQLAKDGDKRSKEWPKASHTLGNRLQRIAPALRAQGIAIDSAKTGGVRMWTIVRLTD
jgi:hypothetical protein